MKSSHPPLPLWSSSTESMAARRHGGNPEVCLSGFPERIPINLLCTNLTRVLAWPKVSHSFIFHTVKYGGNSGKGTSEMTYATTAIPSSGHVSRSLLVICLVSWVHLFCSDENLSLPSHKCLSKRNNTKYKETTTRNELTFAFWLVLKFSSVFCFSIWHYHAVMFYSKI